MAPEFWKKSLLEREGDDTTITDAFSGLWLRALRNTYTDEYQASGAPVLPPLLQTRAAQDVFEEARRRADGRVLPDAGGAGGGPRPRPARAPARWSRRSCARRGRSWPPSRGASASRDPLGRVDGATGVVFVGERLHPRPRDRGRPAAGAVPRRLPLHLDQRHRRRAGRDLARQLPGRPRGGSRRARGGPSGCSWPRAGWRASPSCRSRRPTWSALVPRGLPVVVRIVLLTGLLFFVPSAVLGMVSPVVVKLTLADLGRAGRVVGRIYAWSTLGSIAGTFLTGFALIPWLGTKPVIFGVGLILVALAAVTGEFFRRPGWPRAVDAAVAVLLVLTLAQIHLRGALDPWCHRETSYYCIRVTTERVDGRPRAPGPVARPADPQLQLDRGPDAAPLRLPPDVRRAHGLRRPAVAAAPGALRRRRRLHAAAVHGGDLPRRRRSRSPRSTPGSPQTAVELLGLERRHAGRHPQPGRPRGRGGQAGHRRRTISCSGTPSTTTRSRTT